MLAAQDDSSRAREYFGGRIARKIVVLRKMAVMDGDKSGIDFAIMCTLAAKSAGEGGDCPPEDGVISLGGKMVAGGPQGFPPAT